MSEGVVLTEAAFRALKRDHEQLKMDLGNLRRNLAHVSTRRHEAVWPVKNHYAGTAQATSFAISSASETQVNFAYWNEYDWRERRIGSQSAEADSRFTLSAGILTATRQGLYVARFKVVDLFTNLVQNRHVVPYLAIQSRDDSGAAWSNMDDLYASSSAGHPDSAVGNWAVQMDEMQSNTSGIFGAVSGSQYRLVVAYVVQGTAFSPTISVGNATLELISV